MPSIDCLRDILRAATLAPSADNNQPWQFHAHDRSLDIHLDGSRALPSDVHSQFDLTALGAAIENIAVMAASHGWKTHVEFASELKQATRCPLVAAIRFTATQRSGFLLDQLETRCTNRKRYHSQPVPAAMLARISQAARPPLDSSSRANDGLPSPALHFVTDRTILSRLAALVASCDSLRFQYQDFHEELFRQLRFNSSDAKRSEDGLDVRTLELPVGAATALRLLRPWARMQLLHSLGLGGLLTRPSRQAVLRSGAVGMVSLPEVSAAQLSPEPARQGTASPGTFQTRPQACDSPTLCRDYIASIVNSGRFLQRVWLAASQESLALHPLGSLPIFFARMDDLNGAGLSPQHQQHVKAMRDQLDALIPDIQKHRLIMVFRLGHARATRVRSLRRPVEKVATFPSSSQLASILATP